MTIPPYHDQPEDILMQTIEILDIKPFMQLLLRTDAFDSFSLVQAELHTDIPVSLDGHLLPGFYTKDELAAFPGDHNGLLPWQLSKDRIFSLIKGNRTPSLMKLVLKSDSSLTQNLLSEAGATLRQEDIDGLYLNILFQDNRLFVTCGISYRIFTMDKTLEQEFTAYTLQLLKQSRITGSLA